MKLNGENSSGGLLSSRLSNGKSQAPPQGNRQTRPTANATSPIPRQANPVRQAKSVPEVGNLRENMQKTQKNIPDYGSEPVPKTKKAKKGKSDSTSLLSQRVSHDKPPEHTTEAYTAEQLDRMPDPMEFEDELERESLDKARSRERARRMKSWATKAVTLGVLVLCVYVAFLIYGVTQTYYVYDDAGKIQPEILSIDDKKNLEEYDLMSQYYLRARVLYEETLKLDYRLSVETEQNYLAIAMDYNAMLDKVAKLTVDIDAAEFSTAYSGIHNQILNWVKTDIAVYLQNISAAITNNDSAKAENALISRNVMYADFATLTSNMATLCSSTKGAKNGEIYSWSPESYVAGLE